jgi:hypothetical protein
MEGNHDREVLVIPYAQEFMGEILSEAIPLGNAFGAYPSVFLMEMSWYE